MDGTDGEQVARSLGLEAFHCEAGDDGAAYFLEDGRILKLTASKAEAAVALALLDTSGRAPPCGSVPRVDDVRWLEEEIDLALPDGTPFRATSRRYAIIRESFDDFPGPDRSHLEGEWRRALRMLSAGWRLSDPSLTAMALAAWEPHGPEIGQVLEALLWVADNLGVRLGDIRPSNVGQGPNGCVGMRDLGRAEVPNRLMKRLDRLDFPPVPSRLSPAVGP